MVNLFATKKYQLETDKNCRFHPGVYRMLVFLEMLLGGPPSKYLSHNYENCHLLSPFWSFMLNISISNTLNSLTIKNPVILFIVLFTKFSWPHFTFYKKHRLGNGATDNTMTNFHISIRSRKKVNWSLYVEHVMRKTLG